MLGTIPHIRVGRGVLIVEKAKREELVRFFRTHGVQDVFIRDVILTKADVRELEK
jgi:hypothetical protein